MKVDLQLRHLRQWTQEEWADIVCTAAAVIGCEKVADVHWDLYDKAPHESDEARSHMLCALDWEAKAEQHANTLRLRGMPYLDDILDDAWPLPLKKD